MRTVKIYNGLALLLPSSNRRFWNELTTPRCKYSHSHSYHFGLQMTPKNSFANQLTHHLADKRMQGVSILGSIVQTSNKTHAQNPTVHFHHMLPFCSLVLVSLLKSCAKPWAPKHLTSALVHSQSLGVKKTIINVSRYINLIDWSIYCLAASVLETDQ